jgi:argininosuccinate lyase
MLPALRFDGERALAAASAGYVLATDLADYLVRKGLPFREAHAAVGKLVRYAEERGKAFSELSLAEYRRFSKEFEADVLKLDVRAALAARDVPGGTAPRRVRTALRRARRRLESATPLKASLQAGAAARLKPGLRS